MIKHLLPPANKVCEGNVFTGVCLPTRGGMRGLGACVASGGMRGRARAWGGGWACVAGETATAADILVHDQFNPNLLTFP